MQSYNILEVQRLEPTNKGSIFGWKKCWILWLKNLQQSFQLSQSNIWGEHFLKIPFSLLSLWLLSRSEKIEVRPFMRVFKVEALSELIFGVNDR